MLKRLNNIWAYRKVLNTLVRRDLRVRYSRSFLGYLWTVIEPLANALIYFVVFALIFKRRDDPGHSPYFLFLLTGLLPWQWFNASVSETMRALLAEAKLVRSTSLPRELWVIRVVIAKGIEFVFSLPVLIFFVIWYAIMGPTVLNWQLIYIPVALFLEFMLLIGIGLLLAPTTVLVTDIQPSVRIVLRIMFYLTPIIYLIHEAPGPLMVMLWFNPMSAVLELFRAGFFKAEIAWHPVVGGTFTTLLFVLIGFVTFARLEKSVLKEI